jgi:hypothetical protein
MAAVRYSVREREGTGYGPVIGQLDASNVPPEDGTLIEVKGRLMRVVGLVGEEIDGLKDTVIVESFADPG